MKSIRKGNGAKSNSAHVPDGPFSLPAPQKQASSWMLESLTMLVPPLVALGFFGFAWSIGALRLGL